ncbi:MAG: alanine--glyoxylate aminotransferase family protein [Caldisericia bacterium]
MSKMYKKLLLAPGPTPLPPEVKLAGAWDIAHHRNPEAIEALKTCIKNFQWLLGTKHDIHLLASSGSGAMETAFVNTISPGDKVVVINAGNFGTRWLKIAKTYKANAIEIQKTWDQVVTPDELKKVLDENPDTKAVFCQLSETSSGACSSVKEFAEIVSKTDAIIVVDGVSGVGVVPLDMDDWKVDVVVGGSQKGLMLPPGMGFVAINDKAWKLVETCTTPRFYLNLLESKKHLDKGTMTPWTSAITIVNQANVAFEMMKEEGREEMWNRFKKLAAGLRQAMFAMNLKLWHECPGDAVTAVAIPENLKDGGKIPAIMRDEFGVTIAGAQGDYKGKFIRIGTMGAMDFYDELCCVAALEKTLVKLGWDFEVGAGITAFQKAMLD